MKGIECSISELLKNNGPLKRILGKDDPLGRKCKKFQHFRTRIAVRVTQNFRL